jgi:hypothetical protein
MPPPAWRAVKPSTWIVPGVPMAAWSGPDGSSLVLYRSLPIPDGSARMLGEGLAIRMENLPGTQLLVNQTVEVGGVPAARLELVASGTGDALAPSGLGTPIAPEGKKLISTRRVIVGFVLPGETVYIVWHMPESSREKVAPDIKATLDTLRLVTPGKPWTYS